jgi:hypothetical protein
LDRSELTQVDLVWVQITEPFTRHLRHRQIIAHLLINVVLQQRIQV